MTLLGFAKKIAGRKEEATPQKKKSEKKESTEQAAPVVSGAHHTGLLGLEPLITEESITLHGNRQTFAFRVRVDATKPAIARAVAQRYEVTPVAVRTANMRGKVRRRGRSVGMTPAWKKAYVTLPEGSTIDVTA